MAQFHQHPNGNVFVRSGAAVYEETPENFAGDHGSAAPTLPMACSSVSTMTADATP
jgi:hypothetical protein